MSMKGLEVVVMTEQYTPTEKKISHAEKVVQDLRSMGIEEIRSQIAKRREFRTRGWEAAQRKDAQEVARNAAARLADM